MYFLLGICQILTSLLVINALATIFLYVVWRLVSKRAQEKWSARRRTDFIFVLRVLPSATAFVFVAAFIIPAYLLFEPRETNENVGFAFAAVTIVSAIGILAAIYRILKRWSATRDLVAEWKNHADSVEVADVSIPAYRITHQFPVVAVVGILRPQLFIAEQIFDSLDKEEFQAVIAHEIGHLKSRDNFRRTLLRVCRDLLVFPSGRKLDRDWRASAETAADEYVARIRGDRAAVSLASALVKIARLVPHKVTPLMPEAAYLIEAQTATLAFRVQNLLQITEQNRDSPQPKTFNRTFSFWLYPAMCGEIILLLATDLKFLQSFHNAVELFVALQN